MNDDDEITSCCNQISLLLLLICLSVGSKIIYIWNICFFFKAYNDHDKIITQSSFSDDKLFIRDEETDSLITVLK